MPETFEKRHWSRFIEVEQYFVPFSREEVIDLLSRHHGKARVIAGGTHVIPHPRKQEYKATALVDMTRIPEMVATPGEGASIVVGGLVTHAQAARLELIRAKAGRIYGAVPDVFELEPEIHPELMDMENVVILPRIASASIETTTKMGLTAEDNLIAVLLKGERPPTCINPEIYD